MMHSLSFKSHLSFAFLSWLHPVDPAGHSWLASQAHDQFMRCSLFIMPCPLSIYSCLACLRGYALDSVFDLWCYNISFIYWNAAKLNKEDGPLAAENLTYIGLVHPLFMPCKFKCLVFCIVVILHCYKMYTIHTLAYTVKYIVYKCVLCVIQDTTNVI